MKKKHSFLNDCSPIVPAILIAIIIYIGPAIGTNI